MSSARWNAGCCTFFHVIKYWSTFLPLLLTAWMHGFILSSSLLLTKNYLFIFGYLNLSCYQQLVCEVSGPSLVPCTTLRPSWGANCYLPDTWRTVCFPWVPPTHNPLTAPVLSAVHSLKDLTVTTWSFALSLSLSLLGSSSGLPPCLYPWRISFESCKIVWAKLQLWLLTITAAVISMLPHLLLMRPQHSYPLSFNETLLSP